MGVLKDTGDTSTEGCTGGGGWSKRKTHWYHQLRSVSHLLIAAADVQSGDGGRSDCWAQCELQTSSPDISASVEMAFTYTNYL